MSLNIEFKIDSKEIGNKIIYQYRVDFCADLKDKEMQNVADRIDAEFKKYGMICFYQFGLKFIEGFLDTVDSDLSDDKMIKTLRYSLAEMETGITKVTLLKTFSSVND